jgi:predicted nucleotidyltransferase
MIDRKNENWRNLKLRKSTRKFLEAIESVTHEDYVEAIILFGSEARGEARALSDVDFAVISPRPLSHEERFKFTKQVPDEIQNAVDYRICCLKPSDLNSSENLHIGKSIKKEGVFIYEKLPIYST